MTRAEKIKQYLSDTGVDAFLVTHIPNVRYISGFSGSSAALLITRNKNFFFTDFRYKEQSAIQVKGFEIIVNYNADEELKKVISGNEIKSVYFESTHTTIDGLNRLKNNNPLAEFIPQKLKLEEFTVIKTADELLLMRRAVDISERVFHKLLDFIKPGMTEREVSAEISYLHKKYGAEKDAFDPIVASGWRGALPHGIASDKVIESGEMVTLDFGCVYNGFCSDLTRTISLGEPDEELKKIYDIVHDAHKKAIYAAKAGIKTNELDQVAREFITSSGYGEKFGHGLGHGLGIEVHEQPSVSWRSDVVLNAGTVITIEPGIYIENLGGVRIEDNILIKEDGCDVLNKSSKELIII
ncbi:MAG: aminopeptidase P family protein [Ignavibacteria bacterium]|nr:aminopeptidase P family protein [Ignavibacteria bacterium]